MATKNEEMMDLYTEQIMRAIRAMAFSGQNPMLVGAPGTGKTAAVRALADDLGYDIITLVGSQLDPTDMVGLPSGEKIMEDDNGVPVYGTAYLSPNWQVKILQEKKIILFLDEFSNTPLAVQSSMLTMLQNREFPSGQRMPDETLIIGAMNPADSAADYGGIAKPTANRMTWIAWSPPNDSWYNGMLAAWGKQNVSKDEMKWRSQIVSFIKTKPDYLHKEPDLLSNDDSSNPEVNNIDLTDSSELEVFNNAFPTQRTWDRLSQALPHADNDGGIQNLIMTGLVGKSAATEFQAYLSTLNSVSPEDVIKDPSIVNWAEGSPDVSNSIIRALIEMIDNDITPEQFSKIMDVFDYIASEEVDRGDLAAFAMNDIVKRLPKNRKADYRKRLMDTIRVYMPLVEEMKRSKKKA